MSNLQYLQLQGSHYDVGVALGQFGAHAVHSYLLNSPAWKKLSEWKGSQQLAIMQGLVQQHFPDIWQEILGLSEGLQLSIEDTFMWNCRGDLWAMAPDSCSTVTQTTPYTRITHNEDGDPGFYGHCAVAQIKPDQGTAISSFVYPGSIPGHTFAINEHQLVITVNNVRALHALPAMPRMVLCRALINCTTISEAVQLLTSHQRCGAFHLSIGDASQAVHSVEFNQAQVSDLPITQPSFHANHAIHPTMRNYPQIITGSSGYRQLQGDALIHTSDPINPLVILGDDSHERFPIYRKEADDTDNENTIATADFHYTNQEVEWAVYDGPLAEPVFRFVGQQRI